MPRYVRFASNRTSYGCCGLSEAIGVRLAEERATAPPQKLSAEFCTTAGAQTETVGEALKASGFKPMFKFVNSNTSNEVTFWARGESVQKIVFPKSEGATSPSTTRRRREPAA